MLDYVDISVGAEPEIYVTVRFSLVAPTAYGRNALEDEHIIFHSIKADRILQTWDIKIVMLRIEALVCVGCYNLGEANEQRIPLRSVRVTGCWPDLMHRFSISSSYANES